MYYSGPTSVLKSFFKSEIHMYLEFCVLCNKADPSGKSHSIATSKPWGPELAGWAGWLPAGMQGLWSHRKGGSRTQRSPGTLRDSLFSELLSLMNSCFPRCVLWPFLSFLSPQITEQNCVSLWLCYLYMCSYVCVHVCMCVRAHLYVCVWMSVLVRYMCVYVFVNECVYDFSDTHTPV